MKSIFTINKIILLSLFLITSLFAFQVNESLQIEAYSDDENFISLDHDSLVALEALQKLENMADEQAPVDSPAPQDVTSKTLSPFPGILAEITAAISWDGGAGTTNWNDADNWSNDAVPTSVDDVTLTSGDYVEILVGSNANVNSLNIQNGATLIIGSLSLTVDGALDIDSGGNFSLSGSVYIGGDFIIDGTFTANNNSFVYLNGPGSQNLSGASFYNLYLQTGGTKTATGNIDVDGAFRIYPGVSFDPASYDHTFAGLIENDGTLILGTGSINLDGTGNQNIYSNESGNAPGTWNFNDLIISGNSGDVIVYDTLSVNGDLTIYGGDDLRLQHYNITTPSEGIINGNGGTFTLSANSRLYIRTERTNGTGGADDNFPAGFNIVDLAYGASNSFVYYQSNADQIIRATDGDGDPIIYGNLYTYELNTGYYPTKRLGGNLDINGLFYIGTNVTFDVTSSNYTMNIEGYWYNYGTFTPRGSTVTLDGTTQQITGNNSTTFTNLVIAGSGNKTLARNTTINASINIMEGVSYLNLQTYNLSGGGSATFTLGSNVILYVREQNNFPSFNTYSINSASIVRYDRAGAQLVKTGITYGDLFLAGGNTKSLDGDNDNLTVNGQLNIGGGTTFDIDNEVGGFTLYLNGDYTNGGTINATANPTTLVLGGSNDVTFNAGGTAATRELYNLTVNKTGGEAILGNTVLITNDFNLTAGSFGMGVTNRNMYVEGDWTKGAGATFLHGTATVYFQGTTQTISGDGADDFYHVDISGGTKTLGGDVDVNGNLTIQSGAALDVSAGDYDLYVGLTFNNNNGGSFDSRNGTLTFDGSSNSNFYIGPADSLYNLTVNKSGGAYVFYDEDDLKIANDVNVVNGELYPGQNSSTGQRTDLIIYGDYSSSGNFRATLNDTVFFVGAAQSISATGTDDFNNVTIAGTGTKTITSNIDLNRSLNISSGATLAISGSNTVKMGRNFVNNGTFTPNSSTLDFDEYAGWNPITIFTNGSSVYNLNINLLNAGYDFDLQDDLRVLNDITVIQGDLNVTTNNYTLTIGGSYTIETNGELQPYAGIVIFDGAGAGAVETITTNNEPFNKIEFDAAGTSYLQQDLMYVNDDMYITNGGFHLNGNQLWMGTAAGDSITISDSLIVDAGSQLRMDNGVELLVESGGHIDVVGEDGNPALVYHQGTGTYSFDVNSGGGIGAQYYTFGYMDAAGIYVHDGATVNTTNNFSNGTFTNGASGGTLLRIDNNQTLNNITSTAFPADPGGGATNVTKALNQGALTFVDAGGAFSGAAYENDANGLISWSFSSNEVVWDGSASSDWDDDANWDTNSKPTSANRVSIPSGTPNSPVLTSTVDSTFHLTIESGATLTFGDGSNGGELLVTGDLNILGTLVFANAADTLWLEGDWSNSGTHTHSNQGAVVFVGSNDQNIISGGTGTTKRFNDFVMQKSGGTVMLTEDVRTDGDFKIEGGTFDVNSANYSIQVGGDWLLSDTATFVYRQGTVTLSGAGSALTATGSADFYNLIIDASGITLARAIEILNNLTINGSGSLDVSTGNYGITIDNNWANNGSFTPRNGTVVFNGGNQTISGTATTTFNTATFDGSGTKTLTANIEANSNVYINSVVLDMNAYTITGNGGSNTFTIGGNTQVYVEGTNNFPTGFEDFSISSTSYVRYNLGGDQTVVGTDADGGPIEYGYLYLTNSGTKTANGDIDVNGNLYIANTVTFDLNSNDMTIGLNFDNNQGGAFVAGSGNTITFDNAGTTNIYPSAGGDTFPSLVLAGTGAKVLNGDLTITGNLTLNSTISYFNLQTYNVTGSGVNNTMSVSSGVTLYVRGSNNFPFGFETVNLAIASIVNYDGNLAQNISTTDGDGDQIQYGDVNFRYNTKSLDGDLNLRGRFYIYTGTVLDADAANSYDISVGGYWYNQGTTNLYNNTVTFNGTDNQYVYSYGTTDDKKFHNLVINKPSDTEIRFYNYDVQVDSNVTVTSGIVYPVNRTIFVEGFWTTTSSASMYPSGTIDFSGADQTIQGQGTADFNILATSGSGTKTLAGPVYVLNDVNIGASTTLDVSANNYKLSIEDDFTNAGTLTPRSGTVEFTGTSGQYIYTNGIAAAKQFYDLTINKSGGTCYLGGDLLVNHNLYLKGSTSGIFNANGNNITLAGSWLNSGPLRYTAGTGMVTLYGSTRDTIQTGYTGSYNNQFYDLTINHTDTLIHLDSIRVDNAYSLQQGAVLLNGKGFFFGATNGSGDTFDINASNGDASFDVGAGGVLSVRRGNIVNVASASNTSTIRVVGTELNPANVSYYGATQYSFNVSTGGVIYARYYTFSYMDANGIYINGGQIAGAGADTTEDLSNGRFENGVGAGRYLYVNNSQTLQIDSVTFATSLGASGENVNKPNDAGRITFYNATGAFSDSSYENDPFGRVDWNSSFSSVTWVGGTSSDWHTGANWSGGVIPTAMDNVTIPNVATDPLISTSDAVCAALTIEGGGLLQIGGTRDLTVSGDLQISGTITVFGTDTIFVTGNYTNAGTLNPSTGTFVFNGSIQSLNSGGTGTTRRFNNVLITDNTVVTLANAIYINQDITITNGATLDVSTANRQIYVGGVWTNSATFAYRAGTVEFMGSSAQSVSGSGTNDFYNLEFSGAGTKTLSGTIDINGSVLVNSGTTVNAGTSNLSIEINFTNNGTFSGASSSINFDRTGTQNINGSTTPAFGNITFSGTGNKTLNVNISVNGQLSVNNGVGYLNTQTYTINGVGSGDTFTLQSAVRLYVRNTDNFPTNFETIILASDSYVRYDGTMSQTIRTTDADGDSIQYGWLELYHQSSTNKKWTLDDGDLFVAGRLYVQADDTLDVTTNNYDITVGQSYYNYGSLRANGATVQNVLTMNGTGTQYLQALGNGTGNELHHIVINKSAGVCYVNGAEDLYINGNLSIQSGTFDANGSRGIYVKGNWTCDGSFEDDNSTVHFDATGYTGTIKTNGSTFYNVNFDGSGNSYSLTDDMTLVQTLNISATNTLDVNGQVLSIGNGADVANIYGTLDIDAGADLRLYNTASITIYSGGAINIVGTAGNIATVTRSSTTGSYSFEVQSGATIAAQYYLFEYMDANGIYINGATINTTDNFSNGTFTNGLNNGKFLSINNNNQSLTGTNKIIDVQFPSKPGGTSYNVYVTNSSGSYTIQDATGSFEGVAYEYDPGNVVDWTYTTITRTWTGSTNSDWHTANNWSPQAVPVDSENVVIVTASNAPTITSADATIKSLTLTSGSLSLSGGNNLTVVNGVSIASGAAFSMGSNADTLFLGGDWLNSGTFTNGNSTVVFEGSNLQNINSGGSGSGKRFYNIEINKGATAQVSLISNNLRLSHDMVISSGIFSFGNRSVESVGDFRATGGSFLSGTGTLTMLGSETDTIQSNGSELYNFTINTSGGSIRTFDELRMINDLSITAGTFYTNGQTVSVGDGNGNSVSIQGTLDVNANASLQVQGGSQGITVESGGQLTVIGTSSSALAEVTRYGGSGYFPITLNNGSTISAQYAKFAYTNGSGVDIRSGATINMSNKFDNSVFENGTGNCYLKISNSQALGTVNGVTFGSASSPPTYNIIYDGGGSVLFNNYTGNRAGARYESDNNSSGNGNVRWTFTENQAVTQGNSYTFGNDFVVTVNAIGDLTSITVQLVDNAFYSGATFNRYYAVTTTPASPSGHNVDITAYYSDGTNNSSNEIPSGQDDSDSYLWFNNGANFGPYRSSASPSQNYIQYAGITSAFSGGTWFPSNETEETSLPVELTTYTAMATEEGINLEWVTESEINNLKWILERKVADTDDSSEVIAEIDGMGNVSSKTEYSYLDSKLVAGKSYEYTLSSVSYSGFITIEGTISATALLPKKLALAQNYPNPFNGETTIKFSLPTTAKVTLDIFNTLGQKVKTLVNNVSFDAGYHKLRWNGTNNQNVAISSGVYFYVLSSNHTRIVKKLVYVK